MTPKISTTENKELMRQAREQLQGKWGLVAGTTALFGLLTLLVHAAPGVGSLIGLIIGGPLAVGFATFILAIVRNKTPKSSQIFDGFSVFGTALGAYLLQLLFVMLWSLLLIVPGIIAGISYSMTYYIIVDDKTIGPLEAITKSKQMMSGNKWKFVCMSGRFIGWMLLCIPTLGIGYLWLFPYIATSVARFYEEIKESPFCSPSSFAEVVTESIDHTAAVEA